MLGYDCTVVVPLSTKPMMVEKLRIAGAKAVIQEGASWTYADQHLREVVMKDDKDGVYVPPFDHETIWEAASGIVEESERQMARWCPENGAERVAADVVVCSVGGGGLFSGIALGVERSPVSSKAKIIASETIGADSLNTAVEAGEHVTLPGITSIATSLGAVKVCAKAYEYATSGKVDVTTVRVTDGQAVRACRLFAEEERFLVEPACGAALAPLYEGILQQKVEINQDTKVVVVVCGGANISLELLESWRTDPAYQ